MKKILILFFSIIMVSCGNDLPSKKVELSSFLIEEEKSKTELAKIHNTEIIRENFAKNNFPKNCDWKNLVRIVDGDTIVVENNERVRFVGIDTPETKHPTKGLEKFGLESSRNLKKMLENNQKVCLIYDKIGDRIDKYKRTLAYIFSETGTDTNAEMIKQGFAKNYPYFPFERKDEFSNLEKIAKLEKVGRWE